MNTKKQSEIVRLEDLVKNINPNIISISVLLRTKHEVDNIFKKELDDQIERLKYAILIFLQGKIFDFSADDLKKIFGIYFTQGEKDVDLMYYLIQGFDIKVDVTGQIFALASSGFTPAIKMENVTRREIANSKEEVKDLLKRISTYWKGLVEIDFIDVPENDNEFRIGYDLSGLINENPII